jgi:hypothetical protein
MNLDTIWKKVAMTYFKKILQTFPGGTEEKFLMNEWYTGI